MNSELSRSLAVVSNCSNNGSNSNNTKPTDAKAAEIATASARLIANNKARALQILLNMTQQIEANTVTVVTASKKGVF